MVASLASSLLYKPAGSPGLLGVPRWDFAAPAVPRVPGSSGLPFGGRNMLAAGSVVGNVEPRGQLPPAPIWRSCLGSPATG